MLIKDLYFDYDAKKNSEDFLFSNFNLTFQEGKITFLLGQTGSGKSTLLKLILGLLKPLRGSISMNEKSLASIGYLSADDDLIDFYSVYKNLELCIYITKQAGEKREIIIRFLKLFEICDIIDKRVLNLSSGQRKKVAIIRAMINNPKLLVLDEPEGHFDKIFIKKLSRILYEYKRANDSTIIISSHSLSLATSLADRIVLIDKKPVKISSSITLKCPQDERQEDTYRDVNIFLQNLYLN